MRVGRLEFYTVFEVVDQKKVGLLKPPEKKVVLLNDCLSISPALKESCPPGCTAFYLKTPQCTYTLASTASQEWQNALGRLAFQVSHISPLDQRYSPPCFVYQESHLSGKVDMNLIHNEGQVGQWGSYCRICNFCHFTSPILVLAQAMPFLVSCLLKVIKQR